MTRKLKLGLLGVAGSSGLAYVVQRILLEVQDHPMFELAAVIADDPADAGRPLAEAVKQPWQAEEPLPAAAGRLPLIACEAAALQAAGLDLVISAMPGPLARRLDPVVAAAGIPVISESAGLRAEPDVPLVVPELNAGHLALIPVQQAARGWQGGFIVAAPLCTAVIATLAIKPLADAFGLRSVVMTSLQALSGSGWNGVPSLAILDNLLPWIGDEEEKLMAEMPKILGTPDGAHPSPIAATATRVPVRDGHTIALTLGFDRPVSPEAAATVLAGFAPAATQGLPSAPAQTIILRAEPDRPQPLRDRDAGGGRSISVGRLRPAPGVENGLALVVVGHNHTRGTWGNTLLLAELVARDLLN